MYEYLAVIGALGLIYLILNKLASIAESVKAIEERAGNVIIQTEAMHARLIDIESSIIDCKSELSKIEDVASDYRRAALRPPSFDRLGDM